MTILDRRSALLSLAAMAIAGSAAAESRPDPESLTHEQLLEASRAALEALTRANAALGIGSTARWEVDLDVGRIAWVTPDEKRIDAEVQVIGTYNTRNGSWMWGWDHPSVPEPCARHAKLMKAYGERHRVEDYTTRLIRCSEDDAWDMTAVAAYLAQAQGAYRGSSGATLVFMTFGPLTLTRDAG